MAHIIDHISLLAAISHSSDLVLVSRTSYHFQKQIWKKANMITYQLTNTITYQLTSTITYQLTNTITYQLTNTITYQLTNTITYQLTNTITYQLTTNNSEVTTLMHINLKPMNTSK